MFSFTLSLDPRSRTPMYEQLYHAVSGAIRDGDLRNGEKLPSKRVLCAQLGVSRATVNFMALKMVVEFDEGADPKAVMPAVLANCKKVEDDCEIYL